MFSKSFNLVSSICVLSVVAGCTTGGGGLLDKSNSGKSAAVAPADGAKIVRGTCPKVELREGTAYYRTYAKGGKKDRNPADVVTQASLADTTRQCSVNGDQVTMQVAAAGRLVAGPKGGPGAVTMPIRVAVVDQNNKVIYSQLTKFQSKLPQGTATTQFLFKKDVPLPLSVANTATAYVGFDEGPYGTR